MSDAALSTCVRSARRAVADSGSDQDPHVAKEVAIRRCVSEAITELTDALYARGPAEERSVTCDKTRTPRWSLTPPPRRRLWSTRPADPTRALASRAPGRPRRNAPCRRVPAKRDVFSRNRALGRARRRARAAVLAAQIEP